MNQNRREEGRNRNGSNPGRDDLWGFAAGLVGTAALAGGLYWLTRGSGASAGPAGSGPGPKDRPHLTCRTAQSNTRLSNSNSSSSESERSTVDSMAGYLANLVQGLSVGSGGNLNPSSGCRRGIARDRIPQNPSITNLNSLLSDIYVRFIALNDEDFEVHYRVFNNIFGKVISAMKDVDPYFNRYSSRIQFAGSHYDRLRIKKPDEFDMDIVIGLPLNIRNNMYNPDESDILLEPKAAGFVQLKMGVQFQRLHMRDGKEWEINKAAYEWKDDRNYLLRSNFIDWFKGVVDKALNTFKVNRGPPLFYVDGVQYVVDKSESGPAVTLFIKNKSRGFKLDVDLVPALKFPEDRWPISKSYRSIPQGCNRDYWMVVPKPNKAGSNQHDEWRSWRIALHDQERGLMHNSQNLRQTIRLLKKLRDALDMKKIASYYVKTLFFWEVMEINDPAFWRNNPATLFKHMVKKFHAALVAGKIPYFWNKDNNLIGQVGKSILDSYAAKLAKLLVVLETPGEYKQVAKFLLTHDEFREYNARFLHI